MKILRFVRSSPMLWIMVLGLGITSAKPAIAQTAASAAAAANTQQIAELQKVADRWDDAIDQRDQYALELVLAPEYVEISDTGNVLSHDQVVSDLIAKDAEHYKLTQKVIAVRLVGDVAVVNGTYDRVFPAPKLGHDKAREERGVYSQVYIRARNSWACINSQQTRIEGTAAQGGKKSRDKNGSTNQDMGFHFPGFRHSENSKAGPQ